MPAPLFSVVIPAHNRAATLARVLAAYEDQRPVDLPFEVVVVDDGSTDATLELLGRWRSRRFQLRLATQANQGPARARNRALELASAPLVLFTGDDIEPEPDLLAEHWCGHRAADDPWVAILGLTRWPPDAPLTATMRHVDGPGAQQFGYHWMRDGQEYDFRHFYTSNVSLRRAALDSEPAGFSTDFPAAAWEDAELAHRLAGHGLRIVYRAAARAIHHHSYDARGFFRRQVRSGEMAAVLCRKRPALRKWTDADQLERLRLRLLVADNRTRARVGRVAGALELWQRRAINFAGYLDHSSGEEADPLLLPLFRSAFLHGLAAGMYDREEATRVSGAVLTTLLPPVVKRMVDDLDARGEPFPRADAEQLCSLLPAAHRLEGRGTAARSGASWRAGA